MAGEVERSRSGTSRSADRPRRPSTSRRGPIVLPSVAFSTWQARDRRRDEQVVAGEHRLRGRRRPPCAWPGRADVEHASARSRHRASRRYSGGKSSAVIARRSKPSALNASNVAMLIGMISRAPQVAQLALVALDAERDLLHVRAGLPRTPARRPRRPSRSAGRRGRRRSPGCTRCAPRRGRRRARRRSPGPLAQAERIARVVAGERTGARARRPRRSA